MSLLKLKTLVEYTVPYLGRDDLGTLGQVHSTYKNACFQVLFGVRQEETFTYRDVTRHLRKAVMDMARMGVVDRSLVVQPWERKHLATVDLLTVLTEACKNGHLNVLKFLFDSFIISRGNDAGPWRHDISVLFTACQYGHLHVAIWAKDAFDVTEKPDAPLYEACVNGHLHVVKWLHKTYDFTYEEDVIELLTDVCETGQLAVLKWLHETFTLLREDMGIDDEDVEYSTFDAACAHGHIAVAVWLERTFNVTFVGNAYELACSNNQKAVSKWLES